MQLGPRLLEDERPELPIHRPGDTLCLFDGVVLDRQKIIHHDFLPGSIFVHRDFPRALAVEFELSEQALDPVWLGCQDYQRSHEVTVIEFTLFDVMQVDSVSKDGELASLILQGRDLAGAPPLDLRPGNFSGARDTLNDEGRLLRWEF